MAKKQMETLTLAIPSFGGCTLLPLDVVPQHLRTYEKVAGTAAELDLKEFPEVSLREIQEIFRATAYKLSENGVSLTTGITVIISGVHEAFPLLDLANKDQVPEKCISYMEFFVWEEVTPAKNTNTYTGAIDMTLEEVLITERWDIDGDDLVYCLFLGTIEET